MIRLEKGQRINLEKNNGSKLKNFCVGCNWGAIKQNKSIFFGLGTKVENIDVDLDLSCLMTDADGKSVDHIYSPLFRRDFLAKIGLPPGKLTSDDGALRHSGDDLSGDSEADDEDNEIITVDLDKVSSDIHNIYFFLNNCGAEDFSQIPYAHIRMFEGTPTNVKDVFAKYDVSKSHSYVGKRALIMGRLYRKNNDWKFEAIGDATDDVNFAQTIFRILTSYRNK